MYYKRNRYKVTGIYIITCWNPLHHLCNGCDRVTNVCNKSSCLQRFEEEMPVFSFSASPFPSLSPTALSSPCLTPHLSPLILCQWINVWNDSASVIRPLPKANIVKDSACTLSLIASMRQWKYIYEPPGVVLLASCFRGETFWR